MKKKSLFFRLVVLVTTMMCALGVNAQEAYCCYTSEDKTLTFYYDNDRSSRTGTTYGLNTGEAFPEWNDNGISANVTNLVFTPSFAIARPLSTNSWFYGMYNLESIEGMEYLNTSEVTDMAWMFGHCNKLTSIDLSHFNTSKVTNMHAMFAECWELTTLDMSRFNTANVTDMGWMFYGRNKLQTIYVSVGWSTDAVTNSEEMFNKCFSLVGGQGTVCDGTYPRDKTCAHIDGGTDNPGYFTAKTEVYACYTSDNTTLTFYYDNNCSNRTGTIYYLNDGAAEPDWVTDRTNTNVKQVVIDPSFADVRPTSTHHWFYEMRNLESIIGIYNLNTSEVTRMDGMFYRCYQLTALNLGSFNTSKVTDISDMFRSCSALQTIYVGDGWEMTDMALAISRNVFKECTSLVGSQGTTYDAAHVDADYAHIDGGTSNPGYLSEFAPEAYTVFNWDNTTLTFYYDNYRSSRPGSPYDLNEGENDTGWDTDYTKNYVTQVVFDPSFAAARPTTTYDWFYGMMNLESITGMEYLNTSEVTNMAFMFSNCEKLASLDLSHFNTSKVTSMKGMFYLCKELTNLDMSSFNTSQVTNINDMFASCRKLQTIYVSNGWTTDAVDDSRDMFFNCRGLVGGQGTTYNDFNPSDKTYAHIDGGTSNPGYFTEKPDFLRGDINLDGKVDISDVVALVNVILNDSDFNDREDVNGDGNVDISDVVVLVNIILGQ